MQFTLDNILLIGSVLIIVSIFASKSNQFGIPSLLLFLFVGILAGSEGIGQIKFEDTHLSKFIGSIAMVLILFSGGLDTRFSDIKSIWHRGILLSTIGVAGTAIIIGVFVHLITEFSWPECFLLGSIISSTDASTVFSVLRSKHSGLKGRIRPLLEFESGSNDPMAFFLTILFISIITNTSGEISWIKALTMFLQQFTIGALVGVCIGFAILRIINKIDLDFDGLYSVLMIALAMFTYAITAFFRGNGFLAVYLAAIVIGNNDFIHKRSLTKHFDGQAWLMQIIMFITLGLLVVPSHVVKLAGVSIAIFAFLIVVARPLIVFLLLIKSRFNIKSQIFISWVGLKGAVPIVLAIYAIDANIENSWQIFNIVSLISIMSVALQGTTIPYFSKLLRLSVPVNVRKKSKLDVELANHVRSINLEVEITENSFCNGKSVVEIGIPQGLILNLIERDGHFITPDGKTKFEVGDKVSVIADSVDTLQKFSSIIESCK